MIKYTAALLLATCMTMVSAHEGGEGGGGGSPDTVPLEAMVVNLKDQHYIQIKPLLKLVSVEKAETVRGSVPIIRHALIKFMIGRDPTEVSSPKFMTDFSAQAADALNQALDGKYIKEVLFDSWLVQ